MPYKFRVQGSTQCLENAPDQAEAQACKVVCCHRGSLALFPTGGKAQSAGRRQLAPSRMIRQIENVAVKPHLVLSL